MMTVKFIGLFAVLAAMEPSVEHILLSAAVSGIGFVIKKISSIDNRLAVVESKLKIKSHE